MKEAFRGTSAGISLFYDYCIVFRSKVQLCRKEAEDGPDISRFERAEG